MRAELFKFDGSPNQASAVNRIVVLTGQHGRLVLDEWEARELCGMLPNVLDPITEPLEPEPLPNDAPGG